MAAVRTHSEPRSTRLLVWIALVSVVVVDAGYLALIAILASHPPDIYTVPFVAGYILLTAVLLALSLVEAPFMVPLRPALRTAAAAGLLVLGVLAVFSIGLALLIAGGIAMAAAVMTIAAVHRATAVVSAVLAATLAVALVVIGLEIAWRTIVCPPTGEMGGDTVGVFTGGINFTCKDGHLTETPR
jgi:hypothetical protein